MKIDELIQTMHQETLDSLFILKPENITYVTGFKPTSASVLIIKEEPLLFSSKMDMEEAQQESCVPVVEFKSVDEVKKSLKETLHGKMGVEKSMSIGTYQKLGEDFQVELTDVIERFRVFKSKKEIQKIEGAIKIAEDSFKEMDFSDFSMSENNLAAQLEYNMRKAGSIKPSFETIMASGPRSSFPHASASSQKLESPLMIDWGAFYQNYASDITRTLIQNQKEEEILAIVLEAQKEAIKIMKPGVKASDVDEAARDVIKEYGYGECFIHSTGHGVGLEIHEKPSLSLKSDEKLEKGMVITVEPGIYLEGKFGIRVEDMVLIKNRAKVLTSIPRELSLNH